MKMIDDEFLIREQKISTQKWDFEGSLLVGASSNQSSKAYYKQSDTNISSKKPYFLLVDNNREHFPASSVGTKVDQFSYDTHFYSGKRDADQISLAQCILRIIEKGI